MPFETAQIGIEVNNVKSGCRLQISSLCSVSLHCTQNCCDTVLYSFIQSCSCADCFCLLL